MEELQVINGFRNEKNIRKKYQFCPFFCDFQLAHNVFCHITCHSWKQVSHNVTVTGRSKVDPYIQKVLSKTLVHTTEITPTLTGYVYM